MIQRMPYTQAVALFGERALKHTHSHQRVSNWRRDGVPWTITGPLLLMRIEQDVCDWWSAQYDL